jgi:hypothetical protein
MPIDDTDFEEILALLPQENLPSDPTEARHAVENFVDLVELLAKPLPLPPPVEFSFRPPPSGLRERVSGSQSQPLSTEEVEGRDSSTGFERR